MIVLMRHATSVGNQKNLFSGWFDHEISLLGEEESIGKGKEFKEVHFDECYCSELKRTIQTLAFFLRGKENFNGKIFVDERLNERNWGEFENLPLSLVEKKLGQEKMEKMFFSLEEKPIGGESNWDVFCRVFNFWQEKKDSFTNKNILIVSHYTTILCFVSLLENLPLEKVLRERKIKNLEILKFGEQT